VPNNHKQNLHSDQQKLFSENIILPSSKVSIQIPLVDFNFKNGGTRIIPKTYKESPNAIALEKIENKIERDNSFTLYI
jgi:ectoine hydroxylase-related dioxygenase (phytanoyl-CoA dioxygenase family)